MRSTKVEKPSLSGTAKAEKPSIPVALQNMGIALDGDKLYSLQQEASALSLQISEAEKEISAAAQIVKELSLKAANAREAQAKVAANVKVTPVYLALGVILRTLRNEMDDSEYTTWYRDEAKIDQTRESRSRTVAKYAPRLGWSGNDLEAMSIHTALTKIKEYRRAKAGKALLTPVVADRRWKTAVETIKQIVASVRKYGDSEQKKVADLKFDTALVEKVAIDLGIVAE